jgi:hypothetical protein
MPVLHSSAVCLQSPNLRRILMLPGSAHSRQEEALTRTNITKDYAKDCSFVERVALHHAGANGIEIQQPALELCSASLRCMHA